MREIKFRAWDIIRKEMFAVSALTYSRVYDEYYINGPGKYAPRDETILMQYTGSKDMNGVEMYEKDAVLNQANGKIGYIAFLRQEMGYVIVYKNYDERLGHRNTGSSYGQDHRLKVIGNICENPELIA